MDNEVKKAVDALRRTWEAEFKPHIEQMESEAKASGEAHVETKQAVDAVQDRLDGLEAQLQKASLAPRRTEGEPSQEVKDMIEYVRTTRISNPESKLYAASGVMDEVKFDGEQKVLAIRDETLGGVLAPADFIADVVAGIIQYSPIRDIATVRPTSRTSIQFPKRTGNFAAAWTAETATRTETPGRTYGLDEIPTHELYARVLISNWDLEDPVVDLASIITEDMSEQFGVSEGAAFVSGNGTGKPEGILTDNDLINGANVVDQGASSFTNADGLIKLAFSVKEQYWPNARFVMNRFSLRDIRLLKDSTGNYLWQPAADGTHGLSTGLPATIYGYPYTIAVDYPSAASNAYTVSFGDHKRAYWIADRLQIAMLRDPFTQASAGAVVLHARKRVGGQVVLPEAINVLKMA
jgi:HK97 family phage major capsid protein